MRLRLLLILFFALLPAAKSAEQYLDGADLNLTGQTGWSFYSGSDAPGGAFLGEMGSGVTLITGRVTLATTLAAGSYAFFFKGIDYDYFGTGFVRVAGVQTHLLTSDRDANVRWTGPFQLAIPSDTNGIDIILQKNISAGTYSKFLLISFFVTGDTNAVVFSNDDVISFHYPDPSEYDGSPPVKGNLIPNSSFELGIGQGWGLWQTVNERVGLRDLLDTSTAHHGNNSIKLLATNTVALVSRPILLKSNKLHAISVYYKASIADYATLSLVNTLTPPTGYPASQTISTTVLASTSWQRLVMTNITLHYPASEYNVLLRADPYNAPEPTVAGRGHGHIWFDALQIEEGDVSAYAPKPLEAGIISNHTGNVYYEGESPASVMRVYNATGSDISTNIDFEIYDYRNNQLTNGTIAVVAPPGATNQTFNLNVGRRGIFRLNLWVRGQDKTDEEMVYSIIPAPADMDADTNSILGTHANAQLWQIRILNRLGVKWNRFLSPGAYFRWTFAEPTQGAYTYFDSDVQTATNFGTTLMGNLGENAPTWVKRVYFTLSSVTGSFAPEELLISGVNTGRVTVVLTSANCTGPALQITNITGSFASGNLVTGVTSSARATVGSTPFNTSPDLERWSMLVTNVVTHYTNTVRCWEIWNEPNQDITEIQGTSFYAEMLRRAMTTIKAIDTNILVVAMGGVFTTNYMISVLSALPAGWEGYIDVLSFHLYPPSGGATDTFRQAIKNVYGKPIWNTETGPWDLGFYAGVNANLRTALRNLVRFQDADRFYIGTVGRAEMTGINFLQSIGGGASRYFYYDARQVARPNYFDLEPSMIDYDDSARAKGVMLASLGGLIEHSTGLGKITMASSHVEAYMLQNGSTSMAALWTTNQQLRNVALSGLTAGQIKVYDLMGNEETITGTTVPAGRDPKLIIGQGGLTTNELQTALTSATISSPSDVTAPALAITIGPRGTLTNTNYIRFRWFALDNVSYPDTTRPEALLYSWKLSEVDSDWSDWAPDTRASYEWPPDVGTYVFSVRAKDEAGNISATNTRTFSIMEEDSPPEEPPPGPGPPTRVARYGRTRYPLGGFP